MINETNVKWLEFQLLLRNIIRLELQSSSPKDPQQLIEAICGKEGGSVGRVFFFFLQSNMAPLKSTFLNLHSKAISLDVACSHNLKNWISN